MPAVGDKIGERGGAHIPEAPGPVVGKSRLPVEDQDWIPDAALQEGVTKAQPRRPRAEDNVPVPTFDRDHAFRRFLKEPLGRGLLSPESAVLDFRASFIGIDTQCTQPIGVLRQPLRAFLVVSRKCLDHISDGGREWIARRALAGDILVRYGGDATDHG